MQEEGALLNKDSPIIMPNGFLEPPPDLREFASFLAGAGVVDVAREAVNYAADTYAMEGHRDMGIFGINQYLALVNRLLREIRGGRFVGLTVVPSSVKHLFKWKRYDVRFHRVNAQTLIPLHGEKAREHARPVAAIGPRLFDDESPMGQSLLVGLVSTPEYGLSRMIVGELVRDVEKGEWGYAYEPVDIFSDLGGAYGDGTPLPPDEDVPMPGVTLRRPPQTGTGDA